MKVIRKNGKVFRDRVCPLCSRRHFHGENMCVRCRNNQQEPRKKRYVRIRGMRWRTEREERIAAHRRRVQAQMRAIRGAGLDPFKSTFEEIRAAGLAL
ncbi:MAG: hypothetical protein IH624_02630 [Phycisphaerae bacterium]|nr:hypothetical protein [Phycisphaerae bacterium]